MPRTMTRIDRPIAMEGRMLTGSGSGVGSYAGELRRAIATLTATPLILSDRTRLEDPAPAPFGRPGRWLRALSPRARFARPGAHGMLVAPDIFRLAQVYFDVHRRLLPVCLPGPEGIIHWSYPVPVRVAGWRNIYTVHDAIPLLHPELTPIDPNRHRRLLDAIVARGDRIVTVSEAARADILCALGCAPGFVVDCSEAVEIAPSTAPLPQGLTPGRYLLVLGSVEPRKNIARLCAAYAASGTALPLVIAGKDGPRVADLAHALATPGVVRLPYLPDPVIRALLGGARALLMPSLAEGFGLPVVEAMALGTAVLTAHDGALAETAGGAALLVDPQATGAMADAIRRLAEDDALQAALSAKGLHNARRFTRTHFAERLRAVYDLP